MGTATLACAILSTLMVIVFPAVTKRIIDEVLYQHRAERLTPLVLIAALAFVLQHGLNSVQIILNNTFEQKVIFDLRSDLYSHIQMLPLRWFDSRATGDLMTRILEDVNSVERMLIGGIERVSWPCCRLVVCARSPHVSCDIRDSRMSLAVLHMNVCAAGGEMVRLLYTSFTYSGFTG
jgi:ABC-type bacteriocin/lantibiotic exporter with double-glycine peptidase domain